MLALFLVLAARTPEIALMHHPPAQLAAGEDFVIAGTMVGASEVDHAEIRYRQKSDAAFQKSELELKQGEDYEGIVPKLRAGMIEYYVVAYDFLAKPHEVFASAKRPQRVTVAGATAVTNAAPLGTSPAVAAPPPEKVTRSVDVVVIPAAPERIAPLTPGQRLVLSSQQLLASGVLTVVDALQLVPDLAVSRGIDGRFHIAAMGRRDSPGVRVLLDGQEMNGSATGIFDLDYSVALLERITVTLSTVHATDTSAALIVVALESKHAQSAGDIALRALAGGYLSHLTAANARNVGTYDFATTGGGKSGSLTLSGRAAAFYSGGAQLTVGQDGLSGTSFTQAPGTTNDRQLRLSFGGTLDATVSSDSHLGLDIDALYGKRGNYAGAYDLFTPQGEQRHFDFRTRLYATGGDPAQVTYEVQLSYLRRALVATTLLAPPGDVVTASNGVAQAFASGVAENLHLEEHVIAADARVTASVGQYNRLSARASLQQHLFSDFGVDRNANAAGEVTTIAAAQDIARAPSALLHRSDFSLSLGDTIRPLRELDIDLGLRFSLASDVGVQGVDLPTLLTPVGGITYRPLRAQPGLSLRLSYDTGMRAPTVLERYERTLFADHGVLGNAALRYTASRTLAFDATWASASEHFFVDARGFYNAARGSIVPLQNVGVAQLQDTQAIDTGGISGFGRLEFLKRSFVSGGFTWQRAYSRITGSPLLTLLTDTPQLEAVLMLNVNVFDWLDFFVSVVYTAERRSNARTVEERLQSFRIPAQAVVDVQLRSRALYGLRALVMIHNAFDDARVDDPPRPDRLPGLVPREGFLALLGLEYSYEKPAR